MKIKFSLNSCILNNYRMMDLKQASTCVNHQARKNGSYSLKVSYKCIFYCVHFEVLTNNYNLQADGIAMTANLAKLGGQK